jgi:ribA/ribD-fused uncharacterized protein
MPPVITSFKGSYSFLSNFYPSPIPYEGMTYNSVEHAYQAAKSLDPEVRKKFLKPGRRGGAGAAKRMGQRVVLRPNWDHIKLDIMLDLLRIKFATGELRRALLSTGDAELVEGNDWGDRFYGVSMGEGENHLGKLLMRVRAELDSQQGISA